MSTRDENLQVVQASEVVGVVFQVVLVCFWLHQSSGGSPYGLLYLVLAIAQGVLVVAHLRIMSILSAERSLFNKLSQEIKRREELSAAWDRCHE